MYEEFYGFNEKPFQIVPNPDYLYLSAKHKNALTCLEYGLSENVGFILLTGEIGSGKTTLIRYLLKTIATDIIPAVVFNTAVSSDQLIFQVLQKFGIEPLDDNKANNLELLNQFLQQTHEQNRRALLIIDEAQNITNDALEEIRMLSNIQSDDQLLLQIFLVGQPELKARFKNPALAQFSQRIAVNYHLEALTRQETLIYIVFRIGKAGGKRNPFTAEAMHMIYQASNGIPRTINLLCDSALVYGFADEKEEIDTNTLEKVIEELGIIGLYNKADYNRDAEPSEGAKAGGNGFLQRFQDLEVQVQKLGAQFGRQNNELKRLVTLNKEKLSRIIKDLILGERKKSEKLRAENAMLKRKLQEMEGELPQNVFSLKRPDSNKNG
jgi:putative secretion ATPase (PEP-CTERM system associated)